MSARSRYLAAISPREGDSLTPESVPSIASPYGSSKGFGFGSNNNNNDNGNGGTVGGLSSSSSPAVNDRIKNLRSPSDIRGRGRSAAAPNNVSNVNVNVNVGGGGSSSGGGNFSIRSTSSVSILTTAPPPPPPPPPGPPPKRSRSRSKDRQQQQHQQHQNQHQHQHQQNQQEAASARRGSAWSPSEEIPGGNVAKFQQMLWDKKGGAILSPTNATRGNKDNKNNNNNSASPSGVGGNSPSGLSSYGSPSTTLGGIDDLDRTQQPPSMPPATPPRHRGGGGGGFSRGRSSLLSSSSSSQLSGGGLGITAPNNNAPYNSNTTGIIGSSSNSNSNSNSNASPSPRYKRNAPPPLNREETPSLAQNNADNYAKSSTPPRAARVLASPNRIASRIRIGGSGSGVGGGVAGGRQPSPLRQRVGSSLSNLTPLDTRFGVGGGGGGGRMEDEKGDVGGSLLASRRQNSTRGNSGQFERDHDSSSNVPGAASAGVSTLTAFKRPGAKVGIVFTRRSASRPTVAVISRILPDSIFGRHGAAAVGGGGLEGTEVIAVNGTPVRDPRHAAELVARAREEVRLSVKREQQQGDRGNERKGPTKKVTNDANNDNVNKFKKVDNNAAANDNDEESLPSVRTAIRTREHDSPPSVRSSSPSIRTTAMEESASRTPSKQTEDASAAPQAPMEARQKKHQSVLARMEEKLHQMEQRSPEITRMDRQQQRDETTTTTNTTLSSLASKTSKATATPPAAMKFANEESLDFEEDVFDAKSTGNHSELSAVTETSQEEERGSARTQDKTSKLSKSPPPPPPPPSGQDDDQDLDEDWAAADQAAEGRSTMAHSSVASSSTGGAPDTVVPSVAPMTVLPSDAAVTVAAMSVVSQKTTATAPKSAEIAERRRKVAEAMLLSEDMVEDPVSVTRKQDGSFPSFEFGDWNGDSEDEEEKGEEGVEVGMMDPIQMQRWNDEEEEDDDEEENADDDFEGDQVGKVDGSPGAAPSVAASAALSAATSRVSASPSGVSATPSAASKADERRRAALQMYHSPEMVEDNFDGSVGLEVIQDEDDEQNGGGDGPPRLPDPNAVTYGAADPASRAKKEAVASLMTSWMRAQPLTDRVESFSSANGNGARTDVTTSSVATRKIGTATQLPKRRSPGRSPPTSVPGGSPTASVSARSPENDSASQRLTFAEPPASSVPALPATSMTPRTQSLQNNDLEQRKAQLSVETGNLVSPRDGIASPGSVATDSPASIKLESPAALRRRERARQRIEASSVVTSPSSPRDGDEDASSLTSPKAVPRRKKRPPKNNNNQVASSPDAVTAAREETPPHKPPAIERSATEEESVALSAYSAAASSAAGSAATASVAPSAASSGAGSGYGASSSTVETPRSTRRFEKFGMKKKKGSGATPRANPMVAAFAPRGRLGTPRSTPKALGTPKGADYAQVAGETPPRKKKPSIFGVAKLIRKAGSKKSRSKKGVPLNDPNLFDEDQPADGVSAVATPASLPAPQAMPRTPPLPPQSKKNRVATPEEEEEEEEEPSVATEEPSVATEKAPKFTSGMSAPPPLVPPTPEEDADGVAGGWGGDEDFFKDDPFGSFSFTPGNDVVPATPVDDTGGRDGSFAAAFSTPAFPGDATPNAAALDSSPEGGKQQQQDAFAGFDIGGDSWGEPQTLPVDFTPHKSNAGTVRGAIAEGPEDEQEMREDGGDNLSYDASEMSNLTNPTFAPSVATARPDPEEEDDAGKKKDSKFEREGGAPPSSRANDSIVISEKDRSDHGPVNSPAASPANSPGTSPGKENHGELNDVKQQQQQQKTRAAKKLPPSYRARQQRAERIKNDSMDGLVDPPLADLDSETLESSEDERDDKEQPQHQETQQSAAARGPKSRILSKYAKNGRVRRQPAGSSSASLGSIHDSPSRDSKKSQRAGDSIGSIGSFGSIGSRPKPTPASPAGNRRGTTLGKPLQPKEKTQPSTPSAEARTRAKLAEAAKCAEAKKAALAAAARKAEAKAEAAAAAKKAALAAAVKRAEDKAKKADAKRAAMLERSRSSDPAVGGSPYRRRSPVRAASSPSVEERSPRRTTNTNNRGRVARSAGRASPARGAPDNQLTRKKKKGVNYRPNVYSMEARLNQIKDPIQRAGVRLLWAAAIPIQTQARRFLARQVAIKRMCAVLTIQAFIRRWLAERDLEIAVWSAIQIQASFRGWFARDSLEDNHYCATQIQRVVRGYLATMHVFEDLYSITIVQSVARMHLAINDAVDRLSSTIAIQSWWRGINTRDHMEEMEYGAIAVQANWRRYLAQMSYQFDIIDVIIVQSVARRWRTRRLLASVRLQCFARTVIARRVFDERCRTWAATRIQTQWRGNTAQMAYLEYLAATRIQARWRGHTAQTAFLGYVAATRIQARWRCFVAQERYLIYSLVTRIQARWRCHAAQRRYLEHVSAAKIQAQWRGFVAQERYLLYTTARLIQSQWRRYVAQDQFSQYRSATIIQSRWRGFLGEEQYLLYLTGRRIQTWWRCHTKRRHYLHETSATKIQTRWRGFVAWEQYLLYQSVTKIQAQWRSFLAWEQYSQYKAATKIQARWRGFVAQEQYLLYNSATKIQSRWRSYTAQVHMLISIVNVIVIQSLWRHRAAMKLYKPLLKRIKLAKERKRVNSATIIQSRWRAFVAYSTYIIKQYENKAATTIQTYWRGYWQCMKYSMLYCEVLRIQAVVRGHQERSWHAFQKDCATVIQAATRGFLTRRECHNECMVSILIAAAANSLRVRNAAKRLQQWRIDELWERKEKHAALVIERFFIYVKKEVEKEVQALKKKKKERRRRRKMKQSDEYILERAWLGVADDATAAISAAVPAVLPPKMVTPRYPSADNSIVKKEAYSRHDRYRSREVIQSVEEDAQSDVSGLTDLDFSHRNNAHTRLKKAQEEPQENVPLEKAFGNLEERLAKEKREGQANARLKQGSPQKFMSRRDRASGYPRRYDR